MDIAKRAYDNAIKTLEECSYPEGFHAAYPGYDAVWARDSMITSIGASLVRTKFKSEFKNSLITLASNQSEHGQIPNAVDKFSKRSPHVDYLSIDSSLWFVIGLHAYTKRFKDKSLFSRLRKNHDAAMTWLSYQSWGEDDLLEQLPTTDWQDAFPHRYGVTINTQALYYKALLLNKDTKKAESIRRINDKYGRSLWNGKFYLPWRWKDHNKYKEKGEWFDSLGNILAILFDLADQKQAEKIMQHIKKNKIDKPYPVKAIYPPIRRGTKDWQDYFLDCDAKTPFHYLNGGIWTYIGGFYILALIKYKKFDEARRNLRKLAEANMKLKGNFSEWFHGKTGKPSDGGGQAWNAGMYIAAYECLKRRKVLI
jgi:glycogen debranching enzyme